MCKKVVPAVPSWVTKWTSSLPTLEKMHITTANWWKTILGGCMCKLLGWYYLEGSQKGNVVTTWVLSKSSLASICFFLLVLETKMAHIHLHASTLDHIHILKSVYLVWITKGTSCILLYSSSKTIQHCVMGINRNIDSWLWYPTYIEHCTYKILLHISVHGCFFWKNTVCYVCTISYCRSRTAEML